MPVQQVVGTINEVSTKPWQDRKTGEDITLHSFTLEGQRQYFRTGVTPLKYGVGANIRFLVDGQRVDLASVEEVEAETVQAPAPAAAVNGTAPAPATQSRDGYWAAKEARDLEKDARYQAVSEPRMALSVAVTAASRVVTAGLENEALSFGTTAKSKREAMLAGFIKTIATDLARFIQDAPAVLSADLTASSEDDGE